MSETIVATVFGGLFAGQQVSELKAGKRRREAAESAASETRRKQDEQISKLESQQADAEKEETEGRVRKEARSRQKKRAAGSQGRRSTILTSPLGLPGGQQTAGVQKTATGE